MLVASLFDNAAALSSLVNGSSSVREGDVIVGETWSRIQGLKVFTWLDRVDTSSIPVDGLSRGILAGPWDVVQLRFPESLLPASGALAGRGGGRLEALAVPGFLAAGCPGCCSRSAVLPGARPRVTWGRRGLPSSHVNLGSPRSEEA